MKSNVYILTVLVALTIHTVSQCMQAPGTEKNLTQKKRRVYDKALLEASRTGNNAQIISLLENGSNIDTTNVNGKQPIYLAAENGHTATVELLLDRGAAGIDALDKYGMQPLHWAAENGHTATVEQLLDRGATGIDAPDNVGMLPLHCAAQLGHTATMITLIAHGATIPDTMPLHTALAELFAQSDFTIIPPIPFDTDVEETLTLSDVFSMAAGQNKQETVESICTRHRTNLTDRNVIDALIGSATAGHDGIVGMLHNEMSNDINLRSLVPESLARALSRAVAHRRLDVIRYIIDQDSRYDTPTFCLLRPAGTLVRHRLGAYTPAEIGASERLRDYKRILTMLSERQYWQCHTLRLIGRAQAASVEREEILSHVPSPIISIPIELWLIILNYLSDRHLNDIAK